MWYINLLIQMPRSMLNSECVFVNPLCRAPSPPPAPTQIAAGAYLELHGTADWRLLVAEHGLAVEKKVDGQWREASSFDI